jgi:hypothetical protein
VAERVEHLFIVRVWYERSNGRDSAWRGSVEHVPSQTRFYFSELGALNDFMATQSGTAGAGREKSSR